MQRKYDIKASYRDTHIIYISKVKIRKYLSDGKDKVLMILIKLTQPTTFLYFRFVQRVSDML